VKKFKFSLDKVLLQREIQVDLAQKEFAEAGRIFDQEEKKLEEMKSQKEAAFLQRQEIVQGSTSWTSSVEQINNFLQGQDLRIKKQNERLLEAIKVVESRREILQQAQTEAKMIERLRENKKRAYFKEVSLKEQQEIDELTVIRFGRVDNK